MNIYHFSDSHGFHNDIELPELSDIDVMIFSGDESNWRMPSINEREFHSFVDWYSSINHPNKIMIAGNHSSFIYTYPTEAKNILKSKNIIYLDKEEITIKDIKFYGDPVTPEFGNWCFMEKHHNTHLHYNLIPNDINVLITHGPPYGILDKTKHFGKTISVGCKNLSNVLDNRPNIKVHCFGHIHDEKNITNYNIKTIDEKIYSNASLMNNEHFYKIFHNGRIIKM